MKNIYILDNNIMAGFRLSDQVAFGLIIVIVLIGIGRLIHCLTIDKMCRQRAKINTNNIKLSVVIVLSSIMIILLLRGT